MSRALQICLMLLTAALCGVCLIQWQRESRTLLRQRQLGAELQDDRATLLAQNEKLAAWEEEITRLNAALTKQAEERQLKPDLEAKLAGATRQLEAQSAALTQASATGASLVLQLKKALGERDELAKRLNERTREFNALAEKYRTMR